MAVASASLLSTEPTSTAVAVAVAGGNDVARLVALLMGRPGRLVRWVDVASTVGRRASLVRPAADELRSAGWWLDVVAGAGLIAGPVREPAA